MREENRLQESKGGGGESDAGKAGDRNPTREGDLYGGGRYGRIEGRQEDRKGSLNCSDFELARSR